MRQAEPDAVAPVVRAAAAEDALAARIVELTVVAEVMRADAVVPVVAKARERARLLADIALAVAAARAEREELHHLARVVLVRRPLRVLGAREPEEHRGVARDPGEELAEAAEGVAAQELVLPAHELVRVD